MTGRFLLITDTHFNLSSNVRTGSYLDDLLIKFRFVIDKANDLDATILHAGDFFDKPTVSDEVKIRLIDLLSNATHKPIVIYGNHDRLYGSNEYNNRTSLQLLSAAGVIQILNEGEVLTSWSDCVVACQRPLLNHISGLPIVNLYHGFLNKEDGLSSFMFDDIISDTNNVIVLGHDHIPYDSFNYKNSLILRFGSFSRAIRNDSSERTPVCLFLTFYDNKPILETIPISVAKPVELLFHNKVSLQEKTTISDYTDIIRLLNTDNKKVTLESALSQVTDSDTVNYIKSFLL